MGGGWWDWPSDHCLTLQIRLETKFRGIIINAENEGEAMLDVGPPLVVFRFLGLERGRVQAEREVCHSHCQVSEGRDKDHLHLLQPAGEIAYLHGIHCAQLQQLLST